jgi:hypothetical protein
LHIFNGFGSKGSLTIPYYARQLTAALLGHSANFGVADIRRFDL